MEFCARLPSTKSNPLLFGSAVDCSAAAAAVLTIICIFIRSNLLEHGLATQPGLLLARQTPASLPAGAGYTDPGPARVFVKSRPAVLQGLHLRVQRNYLFSLVELCTAAQSTARPSS